MSRELQVWCRACRDHFPVEVDADWNDGPGGSGWGYYLPDHVACPDCGADCTAAAERATEAGPSPDDLADMRCGV